MAAACAAIFVLTILRMTGLVADQRRLATTDGLTGLRTRRFLEHRLRLELARSRRSGVPLGLFLVDVDHFKLVNDRHGHPAGDVVLVEIGRRLRRAGGAGVLARFGGEEFALLVPGTGPTSWPRRPNACATRWRAAASRSAARRGRRSPSPSVRPRSRRTPATAAGWSASWTPRSTRPRRAGATAR